MRLDFCLHDLLDDVVVYVVVVGCSFHWWSQVLLSVNNKRDLLQPSRRNILLNIIVIIFGRKSCLDSQSDKSLLALSNGGLKTCLASTVASARY